MFGKLIYVERFVAGGFNPAPTLLSVLAGVSGYTPPGQRGIPLRCAAYRGRYVEPQDLLRLTLTLALALISEDEVGPRYRGSTLPLKSV